MMILSRALGTLLNTRLKTIQRCGWLGLLLSIPAIAAGALDQPSATASIEPPGQGMTITGDQEMPQVLYIIPWQEQRAAMPAAPTLNYLIQQPLTPCDTDQVMDDYQTNLWSCRSKSKALIP